LAVYNGGAKLTLGLFFQELILAGIESEGPS